MTLKPVEKIIVVAQDFSRTPGPRKVSDGPFSGEKFYRQCLKPAFEEYEYVRVVLDGTEGYGSSFLDEAFRSLITESKIPASEVSRRLTIVSEEDAIYADEAMDSIRQASSR